MEAGSYVWCSADAKSDEAWILAEVLQKKEDELSLQQVEKKENKFSRPVDEVDEDTGERKFKGVMLANAPLSDEDRAEGRDNDLITLPHLHEPAILHSISDRFFHGKIYTWTGPVLIAVNPFQRLPLYTDEILESYRSEGLFRSQGMGNSKSDLDPHVFAVADRSYRQMMAEGRKSQSILISGESGAGKTESTKIVMSYLTTLGGMGMDEQQKAGELSIMERVLQSNPVLEAFGNARTLRNDNSSRFGKFIELGFSRAGHLLGAKVQTYLLEKVRIAFHASGERNYHIFYQLLRGASEEQKAKYYLTEGDSGGLELPNCFHLTKQGGAPQLREYTDEESYAYTVKAMRALGWAEDTIDNVMAIIAGLLHLGETGFCKKETESGLDAAGIDDPGALNKTCELLGVDPEVVALALTQRVVVARGEEIKTELTLEKAVDARDALAKTIYGSLFLWVVDQVNQSIRWEDDAAVRSSVGVLDIFGFECFAINSFEQLCINFTNEALQQQFNKFIFKLEQAEYEAEKIDWAFISFPDNQDCLDTIQQKKTGILAMLDDECRLPKGSDRNFAKRMYDEWIPAKDQTVSENTRFSATKIQQGKAIFCVRHFAGIVEYRAETNFMEKNKDEVPLTAQKLLETAPSTLIRDVYAIQKKETEDRSTGDSKASRGAAKQKTVGQQFKEQLQDLIASVEKTDPHYIRCLKPNDSAKPSLLNRKRLTEQLRYGGVLEAVRVARAGYPVRLDHKAFFQRYRMLLPAVPDETLPWSMEGKNAQQLCVKLLTECLEEGNRNKGKGHLDPNEAGISRFEKIRRMQHQPLPMVFPQTDVQMGLTKVFMRKPPHDALEAHRVFHQAASVTMIQCWVRGLEKRKQYLVLQEATITAQRCYRGHKGRQRFTELRCGAAAAVLTNHFRMQISRRKFNRARKGTTKYQGLFRGFTARRVLASVKLQRSARMHRRRTNFLKLKSAVVALQCRTRVKIAKKQLKGLMGEQKDIGKLKENNERLKMEMNSLKAMLAAQAKEDASNLAHSQELEVKQKEVEKLEKRVAELEKELAEQEELVKKLEKDLETQKQIASESASHAPRHSTIGPGSPRSPSGRKRTSSHNQPMDGEAFAQLQMPTLPANYVSPEVVAKHKHHLSKLQDELRAERKLRREADGEIIKLRAAINGVQLDDKEVDVLLAKKLEGSPRTEEGRSETLEVTGTEDDTPKKTSLQAALQASVSEGIASVFGGNGGEEKKEKDEKPRFSLGPVENLLPSIRRGFGAQEEKDDAMVVGWKADVRSRKEREIILRDNVHRFEGQLQKFLHSLEEGVDVTMWQLNRSEDKDVPAEFPLKASHVTVKMQRKGDMLVQGVLNFNLKGGYLSKAIGRNRGANKAALEPLSLHDIIEVKAGCSGFEHTELPSATGRTKTKGKGKSENQKVSLFLTITATPTPMVDSRSYIMKFKSRSSRNDVLHGLRSVLADMQITEGVSISDVLKAPQIDEYDDEEEVMIPLAAVHQVLNREREAYDRIMLMLLQGFEDLKEKEEESLGLRKRLDRVIEESAEKDRVQANDSKLIMQLSKKLETLLMDNEDLRDQNDRLNTRLIAAECEKMNALS